MNNKKHSSYLATPLLAALSLWASGVSAETVYVTDMLQLELFETMQMEGRPLKRLRSGDKMEVLKREGRYARVRLEDGETGWVKSLYLIDKEPARAQLNEIEGELNTARETIASLEQTLTEREARLKLIENSEDGAASEQAAMLDELERLRIEKDDLQSRVNAYAGSVPISWLFISLIATFVTGWIAGWYYIDRRSRARHGGYRVY